MVTREVILQRIDQLRAARRNQEAQIYGLDGAIQDCEYWLTQLAEDEVGMPVHDLAEMVADASAPAIVENGRENE